MKYERREMEDFDETNGPSGRPSDNDDLILFYSRDYTGLSRKIIRIKHNDPQVRCLSMYSIDDLGERAWRRLGTILGQNRSLEELSIFYGHPDVAGLFAGLQHNRCIQDFRLRGTDVQDGDKMSILAPFLSRNPLLKDVTLRSCNIGRDSINIISNALSSRPGDKLKKLNLSGNHLGDNDLNELVQALDGGRKLKGLWLADNVIGLRGCTLLARLLRNPESDLEVLHLRSNSVDNQSAIILADSLANNTKLKELALGGNGITAGWLAILKLVCETSSFNAVKDSNHALHDVGMHYSVQDLAVVERALGVDDANLLRAALKLNTTTGKNLVARQKILWSHARGNLNLGDCFIDNGAMPRILAWLGDNSTATNANIIQYHDPPLPRERTDTIRLDSLYRIFRHMPNLCKIDDIDSGWACCLRGVKSNLDEVIS